MRGPRKRPPSATANQRFTRRELFGLLGGGAIGLSSGAVLKAESYTAATITRSATVSVVDDEHSNAVVGFDPVDEVLEQTSNQPLAVVRNRLGSDGTLTVEPSDAEVGTIHDDNDAGDNSIADEGVRIVTCSLFETDLPDFSFTVRIETNDGVTAEFERSIPIVAPPVDFDWWITLTGGGWFRVEWDASDVSGFQYFDFTIENQDGDTAYAPEHYQDAGSRSYDLTTNSLPFQPGDDLVFTAQVHRRGDSTYTETLSRTLTTEAVPEPQLESFDAVDISVQNNDTAILRIDYTIVNPEQFGYVEIIYYEDRRWNSSGQTVRRTQMDDIYDLTVPGRYDDRFDIDFRVCSPSGLVFEEEQITLHANGRPG